MPLSAPRLSKELLCLLSLWLIATLCLLGKSNSLQKYWTQRHHASLPLATPFAAIDGMAQDALDAALQEGPLAFLSRQDPNEFIIPDAPSPMVAQVRPAHTPAAPLPADARLALTRALTPAATAAATPSSAPSAKSASANSPAPAASAADTASRELASNAGESAASVASHAEAEPGVAKSGGKPAASVAGMAAASAPATMVASATNPASTINTAAASAAALPPVQVAATADTAPMPPRYAQNEKLALTKGDKILFAGDSLMQGLVPHITRGLRRDGFSHYLDASKQSTGFSYPATFDWPGKIKTAIKRDGVNTVVIFIGANDAWSLASGGKLYSFGSAPWKAEYTRRVREVVQFAHQHNARVMWLELPPMHYDNLTKGRQVLNDIYRQVAQEESALFIPTARVVSDDQEKFGLFKTLADGKMAQTRTDDGVHFTKLGQTLISKAVLQHFSVQEAQQ